MKGIFIAYFDMDTVPLMMVITRNLTLLASSMIDD